jgi:hypothetical protein
MNNSGGTQYLFTDNGDFTFMFRDGAGNTGSLLASVDRIDKEVPEAVSVSYSPDMLTSGSVVATITLNETGTVP